MKEPMEKVKQDIPEKEIEKSDFGDDDKPESFWKDQYYEAIGRSLGEASKAFGSLLAFSWVLYLLGWNYSRAYLSEFRAGWILDTYSIQTILTKSWYPGFVVCLAAFLSFSSMADTGKIPKKPPFVVRHLGKILLGFTLPVIAFIWIESAVSQKILSSLLWILAYLYAFLGTSFFSFFCLTRSQQPAVEKEKIVFLWVGIIYFVIGAFPYYLGKSMGITDSTYEGSTLPKVEINDVIGEKAILIFSDGTKNIVGLFSEDNELSTIRTLDNDDITIKVKKRK